MIYHSRNQDNINFLSKQFVHSQNSGQLESLPAQSDSRGSLFYVYTAPGIYNVTLKKET